MSTPNPALSAELVDLKSFDYDGLSRFLTREVGLPADCAMRIWKGIWQRGARRVEDLPDLARRYRERLAARATISFLEPQLVLRATDGTVKYLWKLEDDRAIESVLIPDGERLTLCVSSQVGCAMACTFCLTGDLGLKRHLKVAEIANQVLQVQLQQIFEKRITNIVFMGMGEPLHNFERLCTALKICLDDNALNFSHRRVTVSTVGQVAKLEELAHRLPVNIAISLNASTHAQRLQVMPITRKYSLEQLIDACRRLPLPNGKRIAFEYVMMRDFNDSLEDAQRVFDLLRGIRAKVNLIPYNENPHRDIRRPPDSRVKAFQHHLVHRGLNCTIRTTRGLDISAACGQLGKAWEQATTRGWLAEARRIAGVTLPEEVGET